MMWIVIVLGHGLHSLKSSLHQTTSSSMFFVFFQSFLRIKSFVKNWTWKRNACKLSATSLRFSKLISILLSEYHLSLRIVFFNVGIWRLTFQILEISVILTLMRGLTSSLASSTTLTANWKERVKLTRWEWVWLLGIIKQWKSNQMSML